MEDPEDIGAKLWRPRVWIPIPGRVQGQYLETPFLWILSGARRRMSVSNRSKSWGIKALPGVGSCFSWGTRGY